MGSRGLTGTTVTLAHSPVEIYAWSHRLWPQDASLPMGPAQLPAYLAAGTSSVPRGLNRHQPYTPQATP